MNFGKNANWKLIGMCLGLLAPTLGLAQQPCTNGIRVEGVITDPSGAVILGAQVQADDEEKTVTDKAGHYVLSCVPARLNTITAQADGFASGSGRISKPQRGVAHVDLQLALAQVQADVQVSADASGIDSERSSGTTTLDTRSVQELADDPDDFLRQLQALSTIGGGETSTIMVDGFRAASALPPKGSIASIRINPDIFSPEFDSIPWGGAIVQIATKPGTIPLHGALFFTDSDGIFNATDPFSTIATPASKQRYGFEFTGPIVPKKADFSLAFEKRDIYEFNVVNATTLNSDGIAAPFRQTVSAPQRLWIASARANWQIASNDSASLSYSANVNSLGNQGVGGLVLPDAGYSSLASEYDLRFTNTLTVNANLLNETRIGYSWKRTEQEALSTAPSLQVAGYFTSGGSISQNLNNRERDLETDDDVTVSHGKHTLKFGAQSFGTFVHDYDPNTFNGAFVFGGGSAPVLDANNQPTGQTTTITALEQYSRALLGLPGGSPTTYQLTAGTALVPVTQWRLALYGQDAIKISPRLTFTGGVRYQLQTSPGDLNNFSPRLGFAWSPDKKQSWVFYLRAGLFFDPTSSTYLAEVERLNGVRQQETTIYSPNFGSPLTLASDSIEVGTRNQFQSSIHQAPSFSLSFQFNKELPHHWNVHGWYLSVGTWGLVRLRNVNAPMVATSVGNAPNPTAALLSPRPITPNENIMQYENGGHYSGPLSGLGMSQDSYKRFGFSANYKYENVKSDGGDIIGTPQSSYSGRGEGSRVDWNHWNTFTFSGHAVLPYKVDLSTILDARSGSRYNIITGTDNNGDANFNDRPSFATAAGSGAYQTPFGLLTANTVNGNVPRNLGIMPAKIHLDANLSRAFILNPKDKEHLRTLTFNARSANLINHANVTAVNNVLSTALGQAITADTARRVELGVRFSF
jgi:hypothetical protein